VLLASGALLAFAHPQAASAHAIQTTLETLSSLSRAYTGATTGASTGPSGGAAGASFALASSFSTGAPVADASVRLVPPGGTPIALGRTDARGQLNFQLPAGASSDWEVQVDGGPGHRDYLTVPAQAGKAQLDRLSERALPSLGDSLATLLHPGVLALGGLCGLAGVLIGMDRRRRRG
jgi:nickel transport protein